MICKKIVCTNDFCSKKEETVMKKRFLSLAMALVFCLSLMPISAAAYSEESYELWIAGTQVTSANADDVLGDGKVSYDATSNTLSLNGASITNAGADLAVTAYNNRGVVYAGSEHLTVTLTGDNTITATNVTDGYDVDGFYSSISGTKVTFDGTGSLAIYADSTTGMSNSAGVYLSGPSEIAAGTTVTGRTYSCVYSPHLSTTRTSVSLAVSSSAFCGFPSKLISDGSSGYQRSRTSG